MADVFMEIIVNVSEASVIGIDSRDEIEDPLDAALAASGFGEVTGGGGGMGVYMIDVEVQETYLNEGLSVIRNILRDLKVPLSTRIKRSQPDVTEYTVYE
jgi:hypothetical protein